MSNLQIHAQYFNSPAVIDKFTNLLGENRSKQFATSILQVTSQNNLLINASTESIYQAALVAAMLDLPILTSIGHAYIVPYKGKAQFQIGWKGLVQLALRSGQYEKINVIPVYSSQFKSFNALSEELNADFSQPENNEIVGYVAYFRLWSGFNKTLYWSKEKAKSHGLTYSQTYKKGVGNWVTDFDSQALKTVLKQILSKWGPLSMEMQTAISADQAVVLNAENNEFDYPDNQTEDISAEILGNDEILD